MTQQGVEGTAALSSAAAAVWQGAVGRWLRGAAAEAAGATRRLGSQGFRRGRGTPQQLTAET